MVGLKCIVFFIKHWSNVNSMMPMNCTVIFVCLHKENLPFIRTTVFNPIYVGNKYNDMQGFIIDNTVALLLLLLFLLLS